jgi:hypothetical protein
LLSFLRDPSLYTIRTLFSDKFQSTMESPNFKPSLFETIFIRIFHIVNYFIPWHRLPGLIGAFNLDAMRVELRNYNLHDGYASADAQGKVGELPATEKRYVGTRNSDGTDNSLEMRKMGCAGMRFGRNFPRKECHKPTEDELWNPSPRLVSETFMARKSADFKPATTLNLLAAAWIQVRYDGSRFDCPLLIAIVVPSS